jgi:hypothetical protein
MATPLINDDTVIAYAFTADGSYCKIDVEAGKIINKLPLCARRAFQGLALFPNALIVVTWNGGCLHTLGFIGKEKKKQRM